MIDLEEIALRAVDYFGVEHQKKKAIEELSELITELAREQDARTSNWKIAGEVADVLIMAYQLRLMVGADKVDQMLRVKKESLQAKIRKDMVQTAVRGLFGAELLDYPWPDDADDQYTQNDQTEQTGCAETCPIDFDQIDRDLEAAKHAP